MAADLEVASADTPKKIHTQLQVFVQAIVDRDVPVGAGGWEIGSRAILAAEAVARAHLRNEAAPAWVATAAQECREYVGSADEHNEEIGRMHEEWLREEQEKRKR